MASSKRSKAPRSKSARPAATPPPRADRATTAAAPPPLAPAKTLAHTAAHVAPGAVSPSWLRDVLWTRAVTTTAPPRAASSAMKAPAEVAPPAPLHTPAPGKAAPAPAEAAPARTPETASGSLSASRSLSLEERRHLVAKLAYVRAEGIGFGRTNPVEDWLWAEQEVKRMLGARAA